MDTVVNDSRSSQTIAVMRNHASVRKYTDEQIPDETLVEIIDAGRAASTWRNLQSYSIIIVKDPAKRAKLAELTGMPWVGSCPVFLVFVGDLHRAAVATSLTGGTIQATGVEPLLVSAVDAALCAENVLTAAESLGYGGVFIGYVRNFSKEVSELLNLPDYTYPITGLCLGRPRKQPKVKDRLPYNSMVFVDSYGEIDPAALQEYDRTQADYLAAVGAPAGMSWTEVAGDQWGKPARASSTDNLKDKKLL